MVRLAMMVPTSSKLPGWWCWSAKTSQTPQGPQLPLPWHAPCPSIVHLLQSWTPGAWWGLCGCVEQQTEPGQELDPLPDVCEASGLWQSGILGVWWVWGDGWDLRHPSSSCCWWSSAWMWPGSPAPSYPPGWWQTHQIPFGQPWGGPRVRNAAKGHINPIPLQDPVKYCKGSWRLQQYKQFSKDMLVFAHNTSSQALDATNGQVPKVRTEKKNFWTNKIFTCRAWGFCSLFTHFFTQLTYSQTNGVVKCRNPIQC